MSNTNSPNKTFATWLVENDRKLPKQYVPAIIAAMGEDKKDKVLADKIRMVRNGRAKPTPQMEKAFYSLIPEEFVEQVN